MSFSSIHPCFHWCKKYKNRPKNARVIVENKVAPFLSGHSVESIYRCNKNQLQSFTTRIPNFKRSIHGVSKTCQRFPASVAIKYKPISINNGRHNLECKLNTTMHKILISSRICANTTL